VVAADAPGLRESVVHGRKGCWSATALADGLASLAADPEQVRRLGAEGRRFAEGFSWDRAAELTEAHLREVAVSRFA
jgi:glycosyltransferase involved in cell wall biosynthesis